MPPEIIDRERIRRAQRRIGGDVHRTPVHRSATLARELGVDLRFKAESFQRTGSFKVRGVLARLATLSPSDLARGLVSISAGNHAAALAWAAARAGSRATIVMPRSAVRSKIAATEAYGGEVLLTDGDLMQRCLALQRERGLTFVHPFDDPEILAGHAGVGLEILEDVPQVETVVVPVGGGGLIGGVAAAIKLDRPAVRVVGVEPVGADVMSRSLAAGRPVSLEHIDTVADGLGAPFAGEHTLAHVERFVDEVVRVDDERILAALWAILTRTKLVAEPSGAAAYAALLAGSVRLREGECVVCVISGGNLDRGVLASVLP